MANIFEVIDKRGRKVILSKRKMKGNMRIYYDEEGDYLEIFIGGPSPNYGEDIAPGVTVFRSCKFQKVNNSNFSIEKIKNLEL